MLKVNIDHDNVEVNNIIISLKYLSTEAHKMGNTLLGSIIDQAISHTENEYCNCADWCLLYQFITKYEEASEAVKRDLLSILDYFEENDGEMRRKIMAENVDLIYGRRSSSQN